VSKFQKYPFYFLGKENCKDLDVGQNLTEFAKILIREFFILFYLKNRCILIILIIFNQKRKISGSQSSVLSIPLTHQEKKKEN
jgi:hypothetical protein